RLSLRSIHYLVSVAAAVDRGVITEARVREVGWSRARTLVEGALSGRAKPVSKAALARAKRTPARLLTYREAAAAAAKPRLKALVFALNAAHAEVVEAALAKFSAGAAATPGERGIALVVIRGAAIDLASSAGAPRPTV